MATGMFTHGNLAYESQHVGPFGAFGAKRKPRRSAGWSGRIDCDGAATASHSFPAKRVTAANSSIRWNDASPGAILVLVGHSLLRDVPMPVTTLEQFVDRCQRLMAHAWMVRTFVKHSPEVEDFPELMNLVRSVFDISRALETRVADPPAYLQMLRKKLGKLRAAAVQFRTDAPNASSHTNFAQAVISMDACIEDLTGLLAEGQTLISSPSSPLPSSARTPQPNSAETALPENDDSGEDAARGGMAIGE